MRQRGHCRSREFYFFYGKGNENHQFGIGFFVHHGIVSSVNRVQFVKMSYIVLRGRWSNIIVLIVHEPSEEKMMIQKIVFMRN